MITAEEIVESIECYKAKAKGLESQLTEVLEGFKQLMEAEIIPKITEGLPRTHTINADENEVYVRGPDIPDGSEIPTEFHMSLRLLYKGEPIRDDPFNLEKNDRLVGRAQDAVRDICSCLAKKYGLTEIQVDGEPGEIS